MKKLARKNLNELAEQMPVISEMEQRSYIGGLGPMGSPDNPFSYSDAMNMMNAGIWHGGYVAGVGYMGPNVDIWGSGSNNSNSGNDSGWDNFMSGGLGSGGGSGYQDSNMNSGSANDYNSGNYNSGGGGGGGSSITNPNDYTYCTQKWISLKSSFIEKALMMGVDLRNIDISVSSDRPAFAWIENGKIKLGSNFFLYKDTYGINISESKQLSILIHEHKHIIDNIQFSDVTITLDKPVKLSPTRDIEQYIKTVELQGSTNIDEYNNFISYQTFRDPAYYASEVAAYTEERNRYTNFYDGYIQELNYRIWFYQQMYEVAKIYYPQN